MAPTQAIVQAEALAWLATHPAAPHTSVATSLPDRSELEGASFEAWRAWFVDAARAIMRWLPADGVAIFYQTDVRRSEIWVDKSALVLAAAEAERVELVWHKIVCRRPPGSASARGKPGYSHMLCVARNARAPRMPAPDVLAEAGAGSSFRAMGFAACQLACDYLRSETATRRVVDPFCGTGSVLAVASVEGFDVIGVDKSAKCCRAARTTLERVHALHLALQRGAELFDRGEFFAAHEAWEERWRTSRDEAERQGLQGLIQVAAAFHKLFVVQGAESAQRLLGKGLAKLDATAWLPGFDLAGFRAALHACSSTLADVSFDRARVPRIRAARVSTLDS